MKVSVSDREAQRAKLQEWLKPGDTVFTILRHVSQSGMLRRVQPIIFKDNQPLWIGYSAAAVADLPLDKNGNIVVKGCGFDAAASVVESLSWHLFKDDNALKHQSL